MAILPLRLAGDPNVPVSYERACADPRQVLAQIRLALGIAEDGMLETAVAAFTRSPRDDATGRRSTPSRRNARRPFTTL